MIYTALLQLLGKEVERKVVIRACLHGHGGPQEGEVTRLGGVIRLSIYLITFT